MAGRGRRLGYAERSMPLRRPGAPPSSPGEDSIDIECLSNKISEITGSNIDPLLLNDIEIIFKTLCINKDSLINVLSNLHRKALCDSVFGEKLVSLMEHIAHTEIENTTVRAEFLKFLQSDYLAKDKMSQLDSVKFMNAVLLLGGMYWRLKVQGKPIDILGVALLDYLELLLQGDEDQFKVLAKEVFINGAAMSEPMHELKFELFKHSIRQTLVTRNLSSYSRCWLLLVVDLISNNVKPLKGVLRDFYLANLGDDYLELESIYGKSDTQISSKPPPIIKKSIPKKNNLVEHLNHLEVKEDPVASIKSDVDNIRQKMRVQGLIPDRKQQQQQQQQQQHFVDDKKNRNWKNGEILSDDAKIWGLNERNGGGQGASEHDDRFQKDDDFYGIQLPRSAKPRKIQGRNEAGVRKSLDADWKPKSDSKSLGNRGESSWDN